MIYIFTMVFSLNVLILSSSAARYDYFQFTQQYQQAFCNSNPTPCKDPPDKLFTVHGLWPSTKVGRDPEYCKTKRYRKIQRLEPQLEIIWPNVSDRKANRGFWRKQWYKHGSCASPALPNQKHYFETVIRMFLAEKQNVSRILSMATIEPEGKNRTLLEIQNAIRAGTNNMIPKLKCQKVNGMTELVEVTLCHDSNLTQFINCPRPLPQASPYFCPIDDIQY
uniref:Ribonuclease S-2 n=2 Tax=Pyrus pyrifolia TaxID=3767 RepID=RNS2_PYRPY|nr:RecName: Full=Ribonuclease S-2; AltName: Full=S2-RNase; Flags: Precursor [Pyrus pyrifolia]BAA08473.1 ribonuclease [Pyrus pyrifolia]